MGAIEARATLSNLGAVAGAAPLEQLTKPQLQELQIALSLLGYPIGAIDGLIGPKTRNAWAEFKSDVFPGNPQLIGPESVDRLRQDVLKLAAWEKANFSTKQGAIDAIRACARRSG
jgi:peptidoglycan hydrolase-like protein with peptidoglycan-binding domain